MATRCDSDILSRITALDFEPQQRDLFASHQEDTCQAALRSEKFQSWHTIAKHTLFVYGDTGTGKTVLTSVAVEYLSSCFKDDENIGIAYVYYDHRNQAHSTKNLLASLLKQLSQRRTRLPESVRLLYTGQSWEDPNLLEISRALSSVVALFKRTYIFFDAIGDFRVHHDHPATLVGKLLGLQSEHRANLMFTSADTEDLVPFLGTEDSLIYMRSRAIDEDIGRCLDSRMRHYPDCVTKSPKLMERTKKAIVQAANGSFLLAQLHANFVGMERSPDAVQAALARLPSGPDAYEHIYEITMDRIAIQQSDLKDIAEKSIMWLTYAKRPLTPKELETALAVEIGKQKIDPVRYVDIVTIVSSSAGLVVVDKESDIVRLVHPTAKDFFEKTRGRWFSSTEDDVAATCISYLSLDAFSTGMCATKGEFQERNRKHPLYRYAARNWGHHVRQSKDVDKAAIALLEDAPKVESCRQFMEKNDGGRFPSRRPAMHLAAYFGLKEAVDQLVRNRYDMDVRDSDGRTPLSWAAEKGHKDVVQALLLTEKVKVNSESSWVKGKTPSYAVGSDQRTPLSFAAENGHRTVVQLLMDHGAHLDRKNPDDGSTITWASTRVEGDMDHMDEEDDMVMGNGYVRRPWNRSPLSYAAENGHESTVKLLLERGAVVEDTTSPKWKPLFYAVRSGRATVIDLLIQAGASFEAADGTGFTPLLVAILHEQKASAMILIDKGASPNTPNAQSGERPLSLAARTSHEDSDVMVSFLLGKGADIRFCETRAIHNPLSHAAERGDETVVHLLLEHGADPAAKGDSLHDGPLSRAARRGHKDVANALIKAISRTSEESIATLLLGAAQLDQLEVVQCLLQLGESIETSSAESGRTLLSWAAGNGCEAVVRYLGDKGADVESMDYEDRTPLWWACRMRRVSIMRYLRLKGAVIDHEAWGQSLSSLAVAEGHVDVVRYFLEEEADSNATVTDHEIGRFGLERRSPVGRTPLLVAATNGSEALAEYVLSKGPDIEARDTDGLGALTLAARNGHLNIVRLLLASNADSDAADHNGWTPLWHAIEQRKTECALLLLEPKHHIRWKDNDQKTLLGHAAWVNSQEVVERLIERGANINQPEGGKTLLTWACEQKRTDIVKLLCHLNADPDKVGMDDKPPLCHAAEKGQWAVADALLQRGAQIDHADGEGRTALAWAAWSGYKSIVTLLLHRGADANLADRAGRTPRWYATWKNDKDIERLLEAAEAGGGIF